MKKSRERGKKKKHFLIVFKGRNPVVCLAIQVSEAAVFHGVSFSCVNFRKPLANCTRNFCRLNQWLNLSCCVILDGMCEKCLETGVPLRCEFRGPAFPILIRQFGKSRIIFIIESSFWGRLFRCIFMSAMEWELLHFQILFMKILKLRILVSRQWSSNLSKITDSFFFSFLSPTSEVYIQWEGFITPAPRGLVSVIYYD